MPVDSSSRDDRVLIWTPTGKDASLTHRILQEAGVVSDICDDIDHLCREVTLGAGAILLTDETLSTRRVSCLLDLLREQVSWSDIPLLVLVTADSNVEMMLETVGINANVTVLERPLRIPILRSTIRALLRARRRQYETRDLLIKLNETDRQKDLFLATLSHELRTPLTAITGWIRLIRSGVLDGNTNSRGLAAIERNAAIQSQLIEDILSVSRIITGKLRLELREVDLSSIIRGAIDTLRPTADAKQIQIKQTIPYPVKPIEGDPDRLHQVFWNLLSNAIKFTSPGGTVSIGLEFQPTATTITVTDTGKGIAPDFLPYVFDHFRQEDSSYTREQGGLGLGLAIVQRLVKLHGGNVSAQSAGTNKGATFVVRLPAALPAAAAGSSSDMPMSDPVPIYTVPEARDLEHVRILLIEDHEDTREMLTTALHQRGAKVIPAGSVQEALRSFRFSKPDLIVSDIGLPAQDGYEFLSEVVKLQTSGEPAVPAIALTGYATANDRERAMKAGYALHLAKPVDVDVLVQSIGSVLKHGTGGKASQSKGLSDGRR
jgi:signal transduction histidine kinase/ActR/RegA family two-component response regulator